MYAELGTKHGDGPDERLPWDQWPREAPEEGDEQAPDDYRGEAQHQEGEAGAAEKR